MKQFILLHHAETREPWLVNKQHIHSIVPASFGGKGSLVYTLEVDNASPVTEDFDQLVLALEEV